MRSGASRSRPPRQPHDAKHESWAPLASPRQNASRLNVSGRNVLGPHPKTSVMAAPRFVGILARTTQVGRPRDAPSALLRSSPRRTRRYLPEQTFEPRQPSADFGLIAFGSFSANASGFGLTPWRASHRRVNSAPNNRI